MVILFVRARVAGDEIAQLTCFENLQFVFGRSQGFLAVLEQSRTALKGCQRLLEGQLASFHFPDNGFEFGKRGFERGGGMARFAHVLA